MPPRPRYPMPDFFREALESRGLMEACRARLSRALRGGLPYQQKDRRPGIG
jgi:hypothetical protein